MIQIRFAAKAAILGLVLTSGPSYADEPFEGTWSPACKPSPGKEIENKLATIVFVDGAVKFGDFQCSTEGWKKRGEGYWVDLTCFTKTEAAPVKRKMAVRPEGEKFWITVNSGAYKHLVERCG